jgi:hypothetical protein
MKTHIPSLHSASRALGLGAFLALAACSSSPWRADPPGTSPGASRGHPSVPSMPTAPAPGHARKGDWALATYRGQFDAETGQLTIVQETESPRLAAANSSAATFGHERPEAFGPTTRGPTALQIANGSNSGSHATCGDPSQGISALPDSFCTSLSIVNNSASYFNLVWIELSNMVPATVTLAESETGTDDAPIALDDLLDQTTGALNFGNLAPGATSTREFVFRDVGTTNFTFEWTLLAAPSHEAYTESVGTVPFTDACMLGGEQVIFPGDNLDVLDGQALPFPVTIFNVTGTDYSVSPNGALSLDPSFEWNGANPTNIRLPAAGESGGTVFPFWTSQIPRSGLESGGSDAPASIDGQVCALTEGVAPNRVFDVTWQNMRVYSEPNGASSDQDSLFTYTVRFSETTDTIELQYDVLHDSAGAWTSVTPSTQVLTPGSTGGIATIGFQGLTRGASCGTAGKATNDCLQLTYDASDSSDLPLTASAYPRSLLFTPSAN